MKSLIRRVEQTLLQSIGITSGQKICVAISGGPDSTALLALLIACAPKLSLTISACHFDHRFREESGEDASFAQSLADRFNVPFVSQRNNAGIPVSNLQSLARNMRYEFFEKTMEDGDIDHIATGHTADDSVETSIIWMLRGAGPGAFGNGVPVVRGPYIRPLINVRKCELLAWLQDESIPFVRDKSNETDRYLRNRIRRQIIPAMEREAPGAVTAIARLATLCRSQDEVITALAQERLHSWGLVEREREVTLPVAPLAGEPLALRYAIYRLACQKAGLDPRRVTMERTNCIDRLIQRRRSGKKIELPERYEAFLDHAGLTIGAVMEPQPTFAELPFASPLMVKTSVGELEIASGHAPTGDLFSLRAIPDAALVRHRSPGDYLLLKGDRYKKTLKKFLIDQKVPRRLRDQIPLIAIGPKILYVAGLFLSPSLTVTTKSDRCATICWKAHRP